MGFPTPTKTLSTCCSASTTTYCHHCHHSGSVDLIPFPFQFQSFFCICIYLCLCPVRTNHPPLRCGIPFHVRAAWPAGTLTVQRTYRTERGYHVTPYQICGILCPALCCCPRGPRAAELSLRQSRCSESRCSGRASAGAGQDYDCGLRHTHERIQDLRVYD